MSEIDRACVLLADLLKNGPRASAEILAAAEGASISARTMQRAAEMLSVVKTREAFRGGWTWELAGPQEEQMSKDTQVEAVADPGQIERAKVIAARLRMFEAGRGKIAPIYARDPRLLAWVDSGISDPDLREAYELTVFALDKGGKQGPVTVGALAPFVDAVISEGAKA